MLKGMERGNGIIRRGWRGARAAWQVLSEHRFTTVAGTLVFFLIMSLAPFLFWLTLLFGGNAPLIDHVLTLGLFDWARDLIVLLRDNAQGAASGAGIFLIATSLWSSSAFFYHLRRSGEIVYGEPRPKKGWRVRLSAIGMTFAVLFSMAAAGGVLVAVSLFTRTLPRAAAYLIVCAALLAAGFFAAWMMNVYVCPQPRPARSLAAGSALTSLAWLGASGAFSVYLSFGNKQALYGALTLVILFLLWLYWMMICFVAGVIYNKHRRMPLRCGQKSLRP